MPPRAPSPVSRIEKPSSSELFPASGPAYLRERHVGDATLMRRSRKMETAKVDIRKLQALNDRINQCIDALNQVRLSVHGLAHSSPGVSFLPAGVSPLAQASAFGTGFGAGYPGFGQIPMTQGFVPGFSHATPVVGAGAPFIPGVAPVFNPLLGLSHTSGDEYLRSAWVDPLLAARIAQTFPY